MVLHVISAGKRVSTRSLFFVLSIGLPLSMLVAISSGIADIDTVGAIKALGDFIVGDGGNQASVIIGKIRLPRVILAAVVGAVLAMSGAAMQGLFRNPLADPSLIGVTAGASLGASIAIVASGSTLSGLLGVSLVSLGAFVGGLLAVIVVFRLATSASGTSVATMLLAGIAITALAGAITNMLEFYADNAMLRRISLWRMGGLDGANYQRVLLACTIGGFVLLALPRYAAALNALLLGESEARYLGVDLHRVKTGLIVIVAIGVGTSVALAGTIGFVGLVVPHIMRMLIGPDHRALLPASALAGALLLVLADTIARVALAPTELPVGVVTALVGVPFFISLLRQRGHYGMQ
ncbi:MAG: iron complex transport system permease protein [Halieaceae bacterium]|jgi:iron complex transport system permease protein